MDVELTITHPEGYDLNPDVTNGIYVTSDQNEAFKNADFIYAKNWSSFNNYGKVLKKDLDWMITKSKMNLTNNAKFMHCLPIRRNVVASDDVIDSNSSLILNQVENRIYSAQSVLKTIIDGISELAEVFPTIVFPRAVGLKQINKSTLLGYGSMVFNALGPDNQFRRDAMNLGMSVIQEINEQCLAENIDKEGLAQNIYDKVESGEIDEQLAGMLVRSLLSAGIDTTVSAIGNLIWCILKNPDQFAKIKSDKTLVNNAVEEALRLTSPVKAFCRTSSVNTEVSGIKIEEGTKILCVLGAANTDPEVWDNPYQYDVSRKTIGHLALGVGIHNCVGQTLARAEITSLLLSIVEKIDVLESRGVPSWKPNNAMRSLSSLPIRLCPKPQTKSSVNF